MLATTCRTTFVDQIKKPRDHIYPIPYGMKYYYSAIFRKTTIGIHQSE
jgi:hypothetical protein